MILISFAFQDGKSYIKKVNGVIAFSIKNGPGGKSGTWVVDAKNGNGSVEFNSGRKLPVAYKLLCRHSRLIGVEISMTFS